MRSILSSGLAIALAIALTAGCRVDAEKCDHACRNAVSLAFWKVADQEIAAAPADQRDALRQQKLGELSRKIEAGIDGCVVRCQSARDQDTVDCLIAAKTAEQAQACAK